MNRALWIAVLLALAAGCRRGDAGEEEIAPDVSVHVATVARATLQRQVTAYGNVEPEPARPGRRSAGAVISPLTGGVITAVDVVEGQRVDSGAVLVRLDSRLAEVTAEKARQDAQFAEQAYRRQQDLLQSEVTSQRAVQEAKQRLDNARADLAAAETQLAYHRIPAPLAGTVVRLNAKVGQAVDAGTVLASVVDLGRLVVTANVPSREVTGLKVGERVYLGRDSVDPRGTLTVVGRDIDPVNDTYRVMASIPPGSGLTPGSFVDIRIVAEERRNVLAVPVASLVTRPGEGSWIMAIQGDSAVRTPVEPGLRDRGLVEVSGAGVTEGMRIVSVEAYSLPPRTRIRIAGQ